MTAQEIKEKLDEQYDIQSDIYHNIPRIGGIGLGPVVVASETASNHEDMCYDIEQIIHFVDHNVFLRMEGYYCSYGGGFIFEDKIADMEEVFPTQKTITVYLTEEEKKLPRNGI